MHSCVFTTKCTFLGGGQGGSLGLNQFGVPRWSQTFAFSAIVTTNRGLVISPNGPRPNVSFLLLRFCLLSLGLFRQKTGCRFWQSFCPSGSFIKLERLLSWLNFFFFMAFKLIVVRTDFQASAPGPALKTSDSYCFVVSFYGSQVCRKLAGCRLRCALLSKFMYCSHFLWQDVPELTAGFSQFTMVLHHVSVFFLSVIYL